MLQLEIWKNPNVKANSYINKVEILNIKIGNQAYGPQKKCLQAIWTSIGSLSIFYWVSEERAGRKRMQLFLLLPLPPESRFSW